MPDETPRLLIVEDEVLIAMDLEVMVQQLGCTVLGPFASPDKAICSVRDNRIAGAVLDINLGGARVWSVAEVLEELGIPFALASGYSTNEVPERFRSHAVLSKPLTIRTLRSALIGMGVIAA
jgi:CheY-like chemotaxis protein